MGSETQLLIDTPGLNPFDEAQVAGLLQAAADANCEPLAVLAAGGDALETADTALAFAAFGAECLIATKIDATRRIGGILGAAYASGLAFLAASASPRIGDGLTPMSAGYLTDLLLPCTPDAAAGRSAKDIAP